MVAIVAVEQRTPSLARDLYCARLAVAGGLPLGYGDQRVGEAYRRDAVALGCLRQLKEGLIDVVSPQRDQYALRGVEYSVRASPTVR
jgi:hypothetical protein